MNHPAARPELSLVETSTEVDADVHVIYDDPPPAPAKGSVMTELRATFPRVAWIFFVMSQAAVVAVVRATDMSIAGAAATWVAVTSAATLLVVSEYLSLARRRAR